MYFFFFHEYLRSEQEIYPKQPLQSAIRLSLDFNLQMIYWLKDLCTWKKYLFSVSSLTNKGAISVKTKKLQLES